MKSRWPTLSAILFALACRSLALPPSARAAQSSPAAPQAGQLQGELLRLYLVRARIQDLLGLLQTTKWNMTGAEQASFQERTAAVERQLQRLEARRYQFLYHPQDVAAGQDTLKLLENLIPEIREIGAAARPYQNTAAAQLEQAAQDLAKLRDGINAYLAAAFPGKFAPTTALTPRPAHPAPMPRTIAPAPPVRRLASSLPAPTGTRPASETITASRPAIPLAHLKPEQVQKILLNVYLALARINDLLSLPQPEKWKTTSAERAAFEEQMQSVRSALASLEKWRNQFAYHLQDTGSGDQTVAAITDLLPQIQEIRTTVGQFEGSSAAAQFEQPQTQLAGFKKSIASYVAYLHASYQRELTAAPPGAPGLRTERISVTAPPPPVEYLPGLTPPLTGVQVKAILYKVYVAVYRTHDLLTQEHPDSWKAPEPERAAESQELTTLLSRISELQKWRGLFSEYPDNMYYAFQTYRSVEDIFQPLGVFGQGVAQYESASLASDYSSEAGDLQARLGDLIPYMSFILQHESNSVALYQSDLASCQNRLSYAMHGFTHAAIPMKNIVPDFKGRRVERRKAKAAAHHKSRHAAKKARSAD